jgi:hypothetical protein
MNRKKWIMLWVKVKGSPSRKVTLKETVASEQI